MDKRYNEEYWGRLKRNQRYQKGRQAKKREILEIIKEKEEKIKQENSRVREWTEEDEDKMGNMINPCYEL